MPVRSYTIVELLSSMMARVGVMLPVPVPSPICNVPPPETLMAPVKVLTFAKTSKPVPCLSRPVAPPIASPRKV